MSDALETIEITSRSLCVVGLCPETGDEKAARMGETVDVQSAKAATLRRQGKAREVVGLAAEYRAAQDALEADDFQAMRRAASTLSLDVGSSPDKDTLRESLEAALS